MRGGTQLGMAAVAVILLAACSSPQFSRIDANREIYESWPIEIRQAVLDGKVEVGMTPDMVKVAWGKPTEVVSRSNVPGDEEIWIYRTGGDDPDPMPMTTYPSTGMGGIGMGGGGLGGVGITTGRGGTTIGSNIGMGPNIGLGPGVMTSSPAIIVPPPTLPPTPVEEREVVFRNGVVYRADSK